MGIKNTNKNNATRGSYGDIGSSMNSFDSTETTLQRHQQELTRIKKERDDMAFELASAKRKLTKKVKLQVYIDEDINLLLEQKSKHFSRKDGGKSGYISQLLRQALSD